MDEEFYIFKPCKTTAAFQGTLKKQISLDMNSVKRILEKEGYKIELALNDLVIARKGHIVNIYNTGKILIKNIEDEEKAKKVIESIYKKIIKEKD